MPPKNTRLTSLDGLRGVAAFVVLMHHSLLTIPSLAGAYYPGRPIRGLGELLLTYSPVHIVWAGTEAVYLFFILSGFVLALPSARGPRDWNRYFPSRLVRLYVPVWAAVVFGLVTTLLVHRTGHQPSAWINDHNPSYGLHSLLSDGTLLGGISGVLTQLWSLQWEIVFSILLPLYLFISPRIRARSMILGCLVLILVGSLGTNQSLIHLPMFGIGVAFAKGWPSLLRFAERVNAKSWQWAFWGAVAIVSVVLTTAYWLPGPSTTHFYNASRVVIVLGAMGFMLLGALSPAARFLLTLPPIRVLGTMSFSLYLVHEPIVVSLAYLLPHSPGLAIPLGVVLSLGIGWAFYRVVEKPVSALSRRIARSGDMVRVDDPEQITGGNPPREATDGTPHAQT